jgi:hypothetical protein
MPTHATILAVLHILFQARNAHDIKKVIATKKTFTKVISGSHDSNLLPTLLACIPVQHCTIRVYEPRTLPQFLPPGQELVRDDDSDVEKYRFCGKDRISACIPKGAAQVAFCTVCINNQMVYVVIFAALTTCTVTLNRELMLSFLRGRTFRVYNTELPVDPNRFCGCSRCVATGYDCFQKFELTEEVRELIWQVCYANGAIDCAGIVYQAVLTAIPKPGLLEPFEDDWCLQWGDKYIYRTS